MEFLRPLQRRIAHGLGRQAVYSREGQQGSWKALRGWNKQQHAFLHRSSYGYRLSGMIWRTTRLGRARNVRWQSSKPPKPSPNPTENLGSPEPQTLSARMRKLSREYGWSALGVYLGLSALDFPFCFLGVRWLGTERIGRWEQIVVETFWTGVEKVYPEARRSMQSTGVLGDSEEGWGVEEADARNKSESASKYCLRVLGETDTDGAYHSSMDAACARLCHSQVIHFHPCTYDRGHHPQSGQDAEELGMEHWQEKAKVIDEV